MRPLKDRGKPWTLRDVGSSYDYEKTVGEGVYGEVCSRRPAVRRRLHAIDARRLQERMSWLVSFPIVRPFGPI